MPCAGKAARETGCRKIYNGPLAGGSRGCCRALLVVGKKVPKLLQVRPAFASEGHRHARGHASPCEC